MRAFESSVAERTSATGSPMEKREKIAVYEKLLSDPDLTDAQCETIAKLLAKEKAKDGSVKSRS